MNWPAKRGSQISVSGDRDAGTLELKHHHVMSCRRTKTAPLTETDCLRKLTLRQVEAQCALGPFEVAIAVPRLSESPEG
jgi:hypothetical protein